MSGGDELSNQENQHARASEHDSSSNFSNDCVVNGYKSQIQIQSVPNCPRNCESTTVNDDVADSSSKCSRNNEKGCYSGIHNKDEVYDTDSEDDTESDDSEDSNVAGSSLLTKPQLPNKEKQRLTECEYDTQSYDSEEDNDIEGVPVRTKPELSKKGKKTTWITADCQEIPDISTLNLSEEIEFKKIGVIDLILQEEGVLVYVIPVQGAPVYDLETIFFLNEGKKVLGKSWDVVGHINTPKYIFKINKAAVNTLELKKGMNVYIAPRTQYTQTVCIQELLKERGSDASWIGDSEVPRDLQEFSDDDEERQKKSISKTTKRKLSIGSHQRFENMMNSLNLKKSGESEDSHLRWRDIEQSVASVLDSSNMDTTDILKQQRKQPQNWGPPAQIVPSPQLITQFRPNLSVLPPNGAGQFRPGSSGVVTPGTSSWAAPRRSQEFAPGAAQYPFQQVVSDTFSRPVAKDQPPQFIGGSFQPGPSREFAPGQNLPQASFQSNTFAKYAPGNSQQFTPSSSQAFPPISYQQFPPSSLQYFSPQMFLSGVAQRFATPPAPSQYPSAQPQWSSEHFPPLPSQQGQQYTAPQYYMPVGIPQPQSVPVQFPPFFDPSKPPPSLSSTKR